MWQCRARCRMGLTGSVVGDLPAPHLNRAMLHAQPPTDVSINYSTDTKRADRLCTG